MRTILLLLIIGSSGTRLVYSANAFAYRHNTDDRVACALALSKGLPESDKCKDVDRDNCSLPDKYRDYGIEALCLFAEDSALAGHWPANPIVGDTVDNYVKVHSEGADVSAVLAREETKHKVEYFRSRLDQIHDCYVTQKINICDVYRTH